MSRPAPALWAEAIGAELAEGGAPALPSVAEHARAMVVAHGLLPRTRVMSALAESYAPFALEPEALKAQADEALTQLVRLGELELLMTVGGRAYAPTTPRVVTWGGDEGVLLGAAGPERVAPTTVARRGPWRTLVAEAQVGVRSLEDELGLPAWREALVAADGRDRPAEGPAALFRHLAALASAGEPLEREGGDRMRVLAGRGDYFGKRDAVEPEGRWAALPDQGEYLGVRRTGYAWSDMVVSIRDGHARALSRPAPDAWRWAAVGVTQAAGDAIARRNGEILQFLTPLPAQLHRAASLCGESAGPWRFTLDPAAEASLTGFAGPAA